MASDWALIRKVMAAAIDACEAVERMNVTELDRDRQTDVGSTSVSVHDCLQSAWTYPENLRVALVRARHQLGQDKPYTDELARALVNVAQVCAELIGTVDSKTPVAGVNPHAGGRQQSIEDMVNGLCGWYGGHLVPTLSAAMSTSSATPAAGGPPTKAP
jgi:hypothetical protein